MLQSLRVKNLALVDQAEVEFSSGLNVITGETGAGKSILVGALGLVLGQRADRSVIRTGESSCSIEAVFHLPDPRAVDAILERAGLPPCEENQLIVRRVVREAGSSQNHINDAGVTLQVLKELGRFLVDMHGPHDHQSLFDPEFQRDLLDAFGGLQSERASYEMAYAEWRDILKRCEALSGPEAGVAEQIDFLSFRVKEIEDAALSVEEELEVTQEHQMQAHAQQIQEAGQTALQALSEDEASAFPALVAAQRALSELTAYVPEAEDWLQEAREVAARVQALQREISARISAVEVEPARLQWLDQRLAVYERMKRKYGPDVTDVLRTLEEGRQRLEDLQSRGERLAALQEEASRQEQRVREAGAVLSRKRGKAGEKLGKAIVGHLHTLGLAHAAFAVDLRPTDPGPAGLDEVEFGFAPNPGEAMRPLRAIASSGEISRVMLAAKVVLAEMDRIPVLVFDEIDANVGGEMGNVIGRKLATLAERRQVLCITHLPQVAAHGPHHFAVSKRVEKGRTFTRVQALSKTERLAELARMLGGDLESRATRRHAEEMLQRSR